MKNTCFIICAVLLTGHIALAQADTTKPAAPKMKIAQF